MVLKNTIIQLLASLDTDESKILLQETQNFSFFYCDTFQPIGRQHFLSTFLLITDDLQMLKKRDL